MNKKITALPAFSGTPASTDVVPIVDVSGTATTKKVSLANIVNLANVGNLRASNNLSDVASATTSRTNLGLGTAATTASTDYATAFYNIVTKTADYTLTNAENGKVIFCNSSSRIDITIPSGLTSGFNCRVAQGGTGGVRFVASSTTINGYQSGSDAPNGIIGQHGVVDVVPVGSDAYNISGEIGYLDVFSNTKSLSFDGTDDVMTATLKTNVWNTDFAISFWMKPTSVVANNPWYSGTNNQVIVEGTTQSDYSDGWRLYRNGTNFIFYQGLGSATSAFTTSSGTLSTTAWSHIVLTRTSSTIKLYMDKVEKGSGTDSSAWTNTSLRVGESLSYRGYIGLLDEFSVFDYGLTQSNIDTIYGTGVPGNLNTQLTTGPINWYRMGDKNGGSGATITDQGSEGDNGTVANATYSTDVPS